MRYLVQDIETIPETEIQDMWVEEKAKLEGQGRRDLGFDPVWAHKVICIAMMVLDDGCQFKQCGLAHGGLAGGASEKEMIERWSEVVSGVRLNTDVSLRMVDWNGAKFDVPVLQTRAFRYGIQLPWLFGLQPDNRGGISQWSKEYRDKYSGKHDDVSELWTNRGMFTKPHLANLARLMGLPGKFGIDGSKVHEAYKDKRYQEIDTYCVQDVIQTALVFQRYQYMAARLTLEQYKAAATSVVDWADGQPEHKEFMAKVDRKTVLLDSV